MANSSVVGLLKVLLTAETAQFEKALSGADSHVTKLANTMKRDLEPSQKRINMLVRDFLGSKEIGLAKDYAAAVERAGGAAKLTAADQAKVNRAVTEALAHYKALGQQAPASMVALANATKQAQIPTEKLGGGIESLIGRAKMLAGMFGVTLGAGALVSLGRQALATAGQITDMASALGVSTDAVQRWKFAAEQTGASMETIGRAVTQMNDRLATGGGSTLQALRDVGLQFNSLRAMKPEDAFNAIAAAIAASKDPMIQVRAAMDLFSKSGAEVLPAIKAGLAALGDQAPIMSDKTIKALDRAEDRWKALLARMTVSTGGVIGLIASLNDEYDKLWDQRFGKVGRDSGRVGTHEIPKTLPAGPTGIKALPPALKQAVDALAQFDAKFGTTEENLKSATGALKAAEDAKEMAKSWSVAPPEIDKALASAKAFVRLGLVPSEEAIKKLTLKVNDWIAAGNDVPEMLHRVFRENIHLVASLFPVRQGLDGLTLSARNYVRELNRIGDNAALQASLKQFSGLVNKTPTSRLLSGGISISGAKIDLTGDAARDAAAIHALNRKLTITSELLSVVGQAGTGAFRTVMSWVSGATDAVFQYIVAAKAAKAANDATAASAAAAGLAMAAATMGISAIVGGIVEAMASTAAANKEFKELTAALLELGATPVNTAWTRGQIQPLRDQLATLEKLSEKVKAAFGSLGTSLQNFGGVAPKALHGLIKELLTSKHLTADMRKELEAMSGAPTWQVMQERAEKLGIALSALGSNFSQARISDIALQYVRDLTMFEDQSADMTEVLRGMADELSMVAQEAIASGAALPKTLEPYMKRLAEMGLLLDANGQLIDMGALSFKDIEDEALKQMVSFLEEIRDLLKEIGRISLPVPTVPSGRWGRSGQGDGSAVPGRTGFGWTGGEVDGWSVPELPSFAGGTHGNYMDFGPGTPVMLHGQERVSTRGEGSGGTFNIYAIDAPSFEQFLKQRGGAEAVVRSLPREVERLGMAR